MSERASMDDATLDRVTDQTIQYISGLVSLVIDSGVSHVLDLPETHATALHDLRLVVWGEAGNEADSMFTRRLEGIPHDDLVKLINTEGAMRDLSDEIYKQLAPELTQDGYIALRGIMFAEMKVEEILAARKPQDQLSAP